MELLRKCELPRSWKAERRTCRLRNRPALLVSIAQSACCRKTVARAGLGCLRSCREATGSSAGGVRRRGDLRATGRPRKRAGKARGRPHVVVWAGFPGGARSRSLPFCVRTRDNRATDRHSCCCRLRPWRALAVLTARAWRSAPAACEGPRWCRTTGVCVFV